MRPSPSRYAGHCGEKPSGFSLRSAKFVPAKGLQSGTRRKINVRIIANALIDA